MKVNYELRFAVGTIDIVPTVVRALGLKPSPWWTGSIMSDAFQDGVLGPLHTGCRDGSNGQMTEPSLIICALLWSVLMMLRV